jgi:DGQHR domain-containing protein
MARNITVNALRVEQCKNVPLYLFGIDGRTLSQITSISHADRTGDGVLSGYQREQVGAHIKEIARYLSSEGAILPNSIVVAFDERVIFTPLQGVQSSEWGTFGQLMIPLAANAASPKAGWIVDGQQRLTAVCRLDPKKKKSFPVIVSAFQATSQEFQREQFILVNSARGLPRDLTNELVPDVSGMLPSRLEKRRVAARVLKQLRFDPTSPFCGRIRGLGPTEAGANISQNAVLSVIENSIKARGVLFRFYGGQDGEHDLASMARVMSVFFEGVRKTWPDAWDGSPKTSRLVHGVGIVSLGYLMERIMSDVEYEDVSVVELVVGRLECVREVCAWMGGKWPGLGIAWDELQNTSSDKARLTDHLLKEYEQRSRRRRRR